MSALTPVTHDNYFSLEIMKQYMSNSQFKAFLACPAAVMVELEGKWISESRDCFTEGHLFEAIVCGDEELFYMSHPEIISSQGRTKGQPKSNFLRVIESANAFKRQPEMMKIVERCENQKILTGVINGVPYKGCIDLFDPVTYDCWDTKCMKDFEGKYSKDEGRKMEWWELYGYHFQAVIYRELCLQNFGKAGRFGLMAATKEPVPDVAWSVFDKSILDCAFDAVYELSPMFNAIKAGIVDAEPCGKCDYCKSVKLLKEPAIISQREEAE